MVGDDMFATEGDSANVGRQRTATRENGRGGGTERRPWRGLRDGPREGDVSADVLRRLRERVDRNVRLVDRMRADPLAPEPPGLPELIETARRMRHDAETLMLLAGIDAGPRPGAPARLSALLDEAVDATDEPMRVDVRSGPNATVEPGAAIELLHIVSEVVDHVTAIHPGARVEVSSRTEAPGGIVVEIRTASTTRYDPSGRRGMAAASRIAQRSRSGLVLRTPLPGPAGSGAPIATIHCPARAVTVHELDYSPWPPSPSYDALGRPGFGGSNGDAPPRPERRPPHTASRWEGAGLPAPRTTVEALFSELTAETNARAEARNQPAEEPRFGAYGRASAPRATAVPPRSPRRSTSSSGRMVDLPAEEESEATPIYEAVASVWFREDAVDDGAADWESPGDREWRAAAERATQQPEDVTFTAEGLPRRRAGRGWCRPGCPTAAPVTAAGRGGAHARPARRRRTGRAGSRPRPRAPRHLPARAAPGQAPRRPDRPGRSRRLVAACCSSFRTGRSSHRAVESITVRVSHARMRMHPRRCTSGGEGMRPWRSDAGRSVGAVAGMPIAPARCAPAAPTASKTSSPGCSPPARRASCCSPSPSASSVRDAHVGPFAGRGGGAHPRPRRAAGGRRRRRARRRHPVAQRPRPLDGARRPGRAGPRRRHQPSTSSATSSRSGRTARAGSCPPPPTQATRRRWAGRGVWPSRSAAGRCWRSSGPPCGRPRPAATRRRGPANGRSWSPTGAAAFPEGCDTLVGCTTTSPPSATASPL